MTRSSSFLVSWRLVVTFMCFWSITNMMYLRLNMSVAIVCMVNRSMATPLDSSNMTYPDVSNGSARSEIPDGPLQWDSIVQGQVLGAYFYGYAVAKIPTGWVVRRVGGKNLILASSLVASVLSLLIPTVAAHSAIAIILFRVLMGICGGINIPAVQCVLSNWSPPPERSRMGSYTFAGFPCGTLAAFTLSGLLCEFGFAGGWPSVFYTFGIASVAFSFLWAVLISESPKTHRCIGNDEKKFIQTSLAGEISSEKTTTEAVPWKSILTSPAVYAVVVCGISTDFVGNVFLLYLPTYMVQVMNFDLASSGLLSALPYLFCFLSLTFGGYLSDFLIQKTKLTTGTVRKLTSVSGMLLCIFSLIWLSFLDSDQSSVAVALLVVSLVGIGLMTIGYFVNPLDIAPKYSGAVVSIACLAGDISGFVSPSIVSSITAQGSPRESWQIVFLMSAGVAGACMLYYVFFASGEVQPWAQTPQEVISHAYVTDTGSGPSVIGQSKVTESEQDSTERLLPTKSSSF